MSIIMITVFLVISLVAFILKKHRPAFFNLIAALVLIFIIGFGLLPKWTIEGLQTQSRVISPEWKTTNAIIVLGAGTSKNKAGQVQAHIMAYARLLEALRLYSSCKKSSGTCTMFLTGGDPGQNGISEAKLMSETLTEAGILPTDLVLEEQSNNTFQNAQFTQPLLAQKPYDQMYLVTSGIHMSRSLVYFSHFGINPIPAPADALEPIFAPFPISPNFTFFDASMHEWLGIWRYKIYNLFGWNPTVSKPGSV